MCKVVIVEDESLERQALRSILTERLPGCVIVGEAATGAEAIALIDKGGFEVILLDINIPRPSGLEVLQYLREKNVDAKVIITTAHDKFDMAREALRLRADEYLLKPVRPQTLVDTIQTCLRVNSDQLQRMREKLKRFSILLTQDLYCEAIMFMRGYVNGIYEQVESSPEQLVLDLLDGIEHLANEKGSAPEELILQIQRVRGMRLDARNRQKVMAELMTTLDILFESARAVYGHSTTPLQRALNFIERNIYTGTTLDETAENAHVSSCYLSRLFKKNLGVNFTAYVTTRKIEIAKDLLRTTDMPINAISLELSYNDLNYFCKSFKKEVGLSPSEFRKQAEKDAVS